MRDRLDLWKGQFGDDYHARQEFTERDVRSRVWFWRNVLLSTDVFAAKAPSVLEIGAGTGINLKAISEVLASETKLKALEPNQTAAKAMFEYFTSDAFKGKYFEQACSFEKAAELGGDFTADLVFTFGVLIHIPPAGLDEMMQKMYAASKKYILVAEYYAPQEEDAYYRGRYNALWKRPYGDLFMDTFPDLKVIDYGFCWKRVTGLDNITFWLMEKANGSGIDKTDV